MLVTQKLPSNSSRSRWNPLKAAGIGAAVGVLYLAVTGDIGSSSDEILGSIIGGAFGGAFMFGIVAVIRNALTGN